ncbi:hypothetical protein U0070_024048, partial [Myodes glareolus]
MGRGRGRQAQSVKDHVILLSGTAFSSSGFSEEGLQTSTDKLHRMVGTVHRPHCGRLKEQQPLKKMTAHH